MSPRPPLSMNSTPPRCSSTCGACRRCRSRYAWSDLDSSPATIRPLQVTTVTSPTHRLCKVSDTSPLNSLSDELDYASGRPPSQPASQHAIAEINVDPVHGSFPDQH